MRCPFCGHADSQVKDSRPAEDGAAIRRRRQCEGCDARFSTFERVQLRDLVVVKRDGRRQAFDPAKLERAIAVAARKRPIAGDEVERLVSRIQRRLETSGESEVGVARIGELAMTELKVLDTVAYIRFASVYKEFSEAKDFEDFAGSVSEAGKE